MFSHYEKLVEHILQNGYTRDDRTGVGTRSIFHSSICYNNVAKSFPLITSKKMFFKGIVDELLWMLSGSTNINDLPDRVKHIWDQEEWHIDDQGNLGPSYGDQFRDRSSFDQVSYLIENISKHPYSRRHVLSLWNQPDMDEIPLPCCHGTVAQFYVRDDAYLDLCMYARSQDVMIGTPWNIAFYALFQMMIAQQTGYEPGRYIHTGGDFHIYQNHIDKAKYQIDRFNENPICLPQVKLNEKDSIDDYTNEDFQLINYNPHDKISYNIAV